ncbi:MAG: DUF2264 domain-containing protein [Nocardioides sp.]
MSRSAGAARGEWEAAADVLIDTARRLRTVDGAGVVFPGGRPSDNGPAIDALEGFARSFWLAACRMPYADDSRREEIAADYIAGLRAGPTAWPSLEIPQTMVEAASIAFGLWASRTWTWDRLRAAEQERLAEWLLAAVSRPGLNGNWLLFRALTHAALRSFGLDIPHEPTFEALDATETYYRGDGWYTDGGDESSRKFDYYNAWSFATYPLLWALIEGDHLDPRRTDRFRAHAASYLEWLPRLIGSDGAPVYQGRSLIYRAGMTAPLWAAELAGVPGRPGTAVSASTRVLRWFREHGSFPEGVATLGWTRAFAPMAQGYSGPGSPLWLSKAFLGLLLPADAPAWRAEPAPLPIDAGDHIWTAAEPGWLVSATAGDGLVRVLNHGTGRRRDEIDPHSATLRDDPNYNRLAYSTATAPTLDGARLGEPGGVADNSIIVRDSAGRTAHRAVPRPLVWSQRIIASAFDLIVPETGDKVAGVIAVSVCDGPTELRMVRFDRSMHQAELTGWPVSGASIDVDLDAGVRLVADDGLCSQLRPIGSAEVAADPAGPTAFGDRTVVPLVRLRSLAGGEWRGVLLSLTRAPETNSRLCTLGEVDVSLDGGHLQVVWPSGSLQSLDLDALTLTDAGEPALSNSGMPGKKDTL